MDRAPDYGSDGSGFESWQPHQNLQGGDYDHVIVIPFSFGALRSCCELVPPHRISRRLSARLLRLPLKRGVMVATCCRVLLASSDIRGQDALVPRTDQGRYAVVDNTSGGIQWLRGRGFSAQIPQALRPKTPKRSAGHNRLLPPQGQFAEKQPPRRLSGALLFRPFSWARKKKARNKRTVQLLKRSDSRRPAERSSP